MDDDRGELAHRLAQLEKRFDRLEQTLAADKSRELGRRRRLRWTRVALFAGLGLLYAYYIHSMQFDL